MKRLVVFASGEGSNFQAILDKSHEINGEIMALVVDRECNAIKRAEKNNIPVIRVIRKNCKDKHEFNNKLLDALLKLKADYVILAGFMSILGNEIIESFPNKIVNIHPSLLPAFPGINSILKAYQYGVKCTGCTVHFVDNGVDTGPIILQKAVPILDSYDLQQLTKDVHRVEHEIYPLVIRLLCSGGIKVEERKVIISQ